MPKISIATVVLNDAEGFLTTAKSILAQQYGNIEWIVVDGQSTDNTLHYINNLCNCISKVKVGRDNGIYHAMNRAIDMATGDWLIFMNAGDVFYDNDVICNYASNLLADDDILYSNVMAQETSRIHHYPPRELFWIGMTIDHQSACVRTPLYKSLKFDESYKIAGDFDFFSRAKLVGKKFRKISWIIACIKPFNDGASTNYFLRQQERIGVIKKYFNEHPFERLLEQEFAHAKSNSMLDNLEYKTLLKSIRDQ